MTPDLRFSAPAVREAFASIVNGGQLEANGMPRFSGQLAPRDLAAIQLYLADRAWAAPPEPTRSDAPNAPLGKRGGIESPPMGASGPLPAR